LQFQGVLGGEARLVVVEVPEDLSALAGAAGAVQADRDEIRGDLPANRGPAKLR
jgi:hypothetical protein